MNNKPLTILLFFVFIILSVNAFGDGVCVLDQYYYSPGEHATLVCDCSSPGEEGVGGRIVWRNSTGGVLRNVSADSNACRSEIFGDSFLIPSGSDYVGNATFETLSTYWDDAGDVVSDDFNVSGASSLDCLIYEVQGDPDGFDLGVLGSISFRVVDALTNNSLTHVSCRASGYSVDGYPIIFEPYNEGDSIRYTGSNGVVGFQHLMSETVWDVNTSYYFNFNCFCGDENDTHGHLCYDDSTGLVAGYKSCNTITIFKTGVEDYREDVDVPVNVSTALSIGLIIIILAFGLLGFLSSIHWIKMFGYAIALFELTVLAFILWAVESQQALAPLLRVNFYLVLFLVLGIVLIVLVLFVIRLMTPERDALEHDKKWVR